MQLWLEGRRILQEKVINKTSLFINVSKTKKLNREKMSSSVNWQNDQAYSE